MARNQHDLRTILPLPRRNQGSDPTRGQDTDGLSVKWLKFPVASGPGHFGMIRYGGANCGADGNRSAQLSRFVAQNFRWGSIRIFGRFGRFGRDQITIKIALDRVEDTIDELRRLAGRESAGNLERLVDRDGLWCARLEEKFEYRHPKQVPVNDRHALDSPVFGSDPDPLVDLIEMFDRPGNQLIGEFTDFTGGLRQFPPVRIQQFRNRRTCHIVREQHL